VQIIKAKDRSFKKRDPDTLSKDVIKIKIEKII
jgi:hypothetical protein